MQKQKNTLGIVLSTLIITALFLTAFTSTQVVFGQSLPTATPFVETTPTEVPTEVPTDEPAPTFEPTLTEQPTVEPTFIPTETVIPTEEPLPTETPTPEATPSVTPSETPEVLPTNIPTEIPPAFTWNYVVEFPQSSAASASDLLSGLTDASISGSVSDPSELTSRMEVSGSRDVAEALQVLYPQADDKLGLISGAGEISIEVPVSDLTPIVLNLESNLSTGYSWQVVSAGNDAAKMKVTSTFTARGSGAMPQVQTLTFTPTIIGSSAIKLVYRRPFNLSEISTRFLSVNFSEQPKSVDLSNPQPDLAAASFDIAETGAVFSQETVNAASLPASWDWRSYGVVTSVRDQGYFGTCWAFSQNGTTESNIMVNGGPATNLSEQFLVSCNKNGWTANSGGYPIHPYYIDILGLNQTVVGAVLESALPYDPARATCKTISSHPYKLSNYGYATYSTSDTALLKAALYNHGPVSTAVCAGPKFTAYTGGYLSTDESSTCKGGINHYVVLVGWKDISPTEGYWILRNSWGSDWGSSGYMYIKYGISGVGTWASWVDYTANNLPATQVPSGTISTAAPTFKWNSISGATSYEVQVMKGSTVIVDSKYASSVCSGTTCSTKISKTLANGDYIWRVKALVGTTWGNYTRVKPFNVSVVLPAVPVTVAPIGNQSNSLITYTWKSSANASEYKLKIYSYATKTNVVVKTLPASTCVSGVCSYTPALTYAKDFYSFSVAAINTNGISAYSAAKKISFCSTTGFSSQFTANSACWAASSGGTWITGATAYSSIGRAKYWSSSSYPVDFANFVYEARVKRSTVGTMYESGIAFRGTTSLASNYLWKNGYFFVYKNDGTFKVFKTVNGVQTVLQNWKASSAIVKKGWNVLKVSTSGSTIICYINGVKVWQGSDSQFTSGRAGVLMNDGGTGQTYYVDYAKLTVK